MDESLAQYLITQEENRQYKERSAELALYRFFNLKAPLMIQGKSYHTSPISLAKLKMLKSILESPQGHRDIMDRLQLATHDMSVSHKKIVEAAYLRSVRERGVTAMSGHEMAISMLLFSPQNQPQSMGA